MPLRLGLLLWEKIRFMLQGMQPSKNGCPKKTKQPMLFMKKQKKVNKEVLLMAIKEPESMHDLIYFTNRQLMGGKGSAKAWVYKGICPKCKKGTMGKPRDAKTGKAKIRAKEYVCPACSFTMECEAYEDTLTCQIMYQCPKCSKEQEIEIPYQRKKVMLFDEETQKKKSADALSFACGSCGEKIHITKKMKE